MRTAEQSNFGLAGPHATSHHQHFKMVNLLIESCAFAIKGLNPKAQQHHPAVKVRKEENEKKMKKENVEEE